VFASFELCGNMIVVPFAHASRMRESFYHEHSQLVVLRPGATNDPDRRFSARFSFARADRSLSLVVRNQTRIADFSNAVPRKVVKKNRHEYMFASLRHLGLDCGAIRHGVTTRLGLRLCPMWDDVTCSWT
jgi:hypothetical protein